MAKSFVSPGVFTNEVDSSFLGPGVGQIGASIIGTSAKGPAFVPITVTNFSEFVNFFGDLDEDHNLGYAARAYLKNAGSANIVRVLGPEGRTVNGATVAAGYTAEETWMINALTGSVAHNMAMMEVTGSHDIIITDLVDDEFYIEVISKDSVTTIIEVTASFLTSSDNYIGKVLNTDPTLFAEKGYYVRDIYNYAFPKLGGNGNAEFASSSVDLTNFVRGYNSGSTPWIKSQLFGGSEEYNLFRLHTIGHGEAENGRFKISVKNIRTSVAPSVSEYGKFDLEVRDFANKDASSVAVQTIPNLSMDPADPNYIARTIGTRFLKYDTSRDKMVEHGDFPNGSVLVYVEMATGSIPPAALPWGFRGLPKPDIHVTDLESFVQLPYVADLKDKATQSEAKDNVYWGMETELSGNVAARLTWLPTMTGSDPDFSMYNIAGTSLGTLTYNTANPVSTRKAPGETTSATVIASDLAKFTVPIAFGTDGFDRRISDPVANAAQMATVSQLATQAFRQGVDIIKDPDFIDINILSIPGVNSSKVVDYGIDKMTARADVFYPFDVTGSTTTAVVSEVRGRGFDNNYCATYYPDVKVWDDVNNVVKTLPASIAALGCIAYNDRVAYPWYAPAGLNRAGLNSDSIGFSVLGIVDQLNKTERDSLYENRVNPIARFPDVPQGVIWGQKTMQIKESALDRINVRRLMIHAKKLVSSAVKFLVFEQANGSTMTRFSQLVNPILSDIQIKNGIQTFKVIMDETTSPPELIDRNRLHGKIYLVPTASAEAISIDFIISPQGASFED